MKRWSGGKDKMYPTYEQGFYGSSHDHAMLPYLTAPDLNRHPPEIFMDSRQHPGSTAVGKSTCFSTEPEAYPDEWQHKNREDWTEMDVLHWIASVALDRDFSFEDVNAQAFRVSGSILLSLSSQQFHQRDSQYGHLLYNSLHNLITPQNIYMDNMHNIGGKYIPEDVNSSNLHNTQCFSDLNDNYSFPNEIKQENKESDFGPSDSETEPPPKKIKRPPGRPPGAKAKAKAEKKTGRLWEFIRNLLHNPEFCPSAICWEDHDEGVFRFVKSEKVAKIWGKRKNNEKMNYEKLSRAMRYYYKSQVFLPVLGRKLVYKFGPNAKGWRSDNPNFRNKPANPNN